MIAVTTDNFQIKKSDFSSYFAENILILLKTYCGYTNFRTASGTNNLCFSA